MKNDINIDNNFILNAILLIGAIVLMAMGADGWGWLLLVYFLI